MGGGDSAATEALFLTRFGSTVHVVHRRDELRASKIMADRMMADEKIVMHWNSRVVDLAGEGKLGPGKRSRSRPKIVEAALVASC